MKSKLKKTISFLLNPHLLLCFGMAWMLTNGWSYAALVLGSVFRISWLSGIASAYLAVLWLPFTPEKIITVLIAIWLLKLLFPHDERTLAVLNRLKNKCSRNKKPTEAGSFPLQEDR